MSNVLIAYYSRKDENYVSGELKYLSVGNTEVIANYIAKETKGDVFKIEQEKPYSKEYNECIEEARRDQINNNYLPLKNYLDNIDKYDVIYLGYPNYWNTMPMAVFTFLSKYDFKGKEIKPFCTHEGSRLGNSVSDIKMICKDAIVKEGLPIKGSNVNNSLEEVKKWIYK